MANETEITAVDTDSLSLEELRALAFKESQEAEAAEAKTEAEKPEVKVEAKVEVEPPAEEEEDQEFIVTREIDLGDGSGIQRFTGKGTSEKEAYEAFADKLIDAQTNATKKINELSKQVKQEKTLTEQEKTDLEYVIQQRMAKEPGKTVKELVREEISEMAASTARSNRAQVDFVNTHPLYVADPKTGNGDRIAAEFERLYPKANEFTEAGLEKAYQNLKTSGLLVLKSEEADASTETETEETERIAQPKAEVTQTRSSKKSSTVSTKGSRAPAVKTEPSLDEAESMPMDKLRELARKALLASQQQD